MNARPTPSAPNEPSAYDWAGARGDKWRDKVDPMEAMLAPVDEPLILALSIDRAYRIADIGCGGGGTTFAIARRAPAGSSVQGVDISATLIETARTRQPRELSSIEFIQANVATAPPPAGLYERLVSRFGVMFFDDPAAAFRNLASWLAPGGRFAFAVWGPATGNRWMTAVRDAVAEVVEVPPADPEAPGPFRYGDAGKLLALLQRAGLSELQASEWRGSLALGGGLPAPEAAEFALRSFSVAERLAEAGEAGWADARRALTAYLSRHLKDGCVRMETSVNIVTGARAA